MRTGLEFLRNSRKAGEAGPEWEKDVGDEQEKKERLGRPGRPCRPRRGPGSHSGEKPLEVFTQETKTI